MARPTKPAGCFLQLLGGICVLAGLGALLQGAGGGGLVALLAGVALLLWGRQAIHPHTVVSREPFQPPAADDLPSAQTSAAPGEYVDPLVARFRYWPHSLVVAAVAGVALAIIYNKPQSNLDSSSEISQYRTSGRSTYRDDRQGPSTSSLRQTGKPVVTAIERTEHIIVHSEPSANYYLLNLQTRLDGLIEVVSRREGRSGISYAKRLVDCAGGTALYLGEGDTLEDMQQSKPDTELWELCCGSISAYVAVHACDRAGSPMPRRVLN